MEKVEFRGPSDIIGDPLLKQNISKYHSLIHNTHFYIYKELITYSIFIKSDSNNTYSKNLYNWKKN